MANLRPVKIDSEVVVRALLAAGASVARLTDNARPTAPPIEAARVGAYGCIAPLVEAGAVLNRYPHAPWVGPLLVAASEGEGRTDILRLLMKLGADVHAQSTKRTHWSSISQPALHASGCRGRCNVMQVLVEELGADPMTLDKWGNSPLHVAASNSQASACELLVKHTQVSGLVTVTAALLAKNNKGWTPLYRAMDKVRPSAKCVSKTLELLKVSGGSLAVKTAWTETTGDKGRTVVHLAAQDEEYTGCVRAFVGVPEGVQVALEVTDNDVQTAVALAKKAGHDFNSIPGFAQVTWVPCCASILNAFSRVVARLLRRAKMALARWH